jgi:predicted metal-dependent enzyme (double-stranded beta helix superfamily)
MSWTPSLPQGLAAFCEECSRLLRGVTHNQASIDRIAPALSRLLHERDLFAALLRDVVEGREVVDLRRATMFDNELLLYADPSRLFSLRMYLYGPGDYTPVHDHNSWGVIGPVSGELEVTDYVRADDGSREGYARLEERGAARLVPGETDCTLPLNAGIHKVGNPTGETVGSLSLYGKPISRDHICGFDVARDQVYPIFAPKTKKTRLAAEALRGLSAVG